MRSPRNLATWWKQATEGVTYVRCRLPARHLPGQVLSLTHTDLQEQDGGLVYPRQEGAAVWSFSGNTTRALMMAGMQEAGFRVLMEADDNYLTDPPLRIGAWHQNFKTALACDGHSFEGFRRILRFCDGTIVSTPWLADLYSRFNPDVFVCPNTVDPPDWPDNPPHQPDGVLRVGWAASDSHAFDAPLISRALDWCSRQPNTKVVIIGIKPHLTGFPFPYEHVGWTDSLDEYRQALAGIDLMLCPLKPSFWADGKSDLKALEATMAGAASVVSPVEAYRLWWDRTHTASTAKEFLKVVKHLVRHPGEVYELMCDARKYVLEQRTIQQNIHKWREAVGGEP